VIAVRTEGRRKEEDQEEETRRAASCRRKLNVQRNVRKENVRARQNKNVVEMTVFLSLLIARSQCINANVDQYNALTVVLESVGCLSDPGDNCGTMSMNLTSACSAFSNDGGRDALEIRCDSEGNVVTLELELVALTTPSIATNVGLLNRLTVLSFYEVSLQSTVPSEIGLLTQLIFLGLHVNPGLTGEHTSRKAGGVIERILNLRRFHRNVAIATVVVDKSALFLCVWRWSLRRCAIDRRQFQ
jgi:hypothetical protein